MIDVGTNSAKISVMEVINGVPGRIALDESDITRLGEGVGDSKRLTEAAMERTALRVAAFVTKARAMGVSEIRIVGTSAMRDAANRAEFIERLYKSTGIALDVIDGEREAALAYAAVRADPIIADNLVGQLLVFDIGGGSTELILGENLTAMRKVSLNMGAVRLTERYIRSDPPSLQEIAAVRAEIADCLEAARNMGKPAIAAGIGGTVVTIAAVIHECDPPDPEQLHGAYLSLQDVDRALTRFVSLPLEERRKIPGLDPKRADVIISGTLILLSMLKSCDLNGFTVSTRGLRFGLLAEMAAGLPV